MQNILVNFKLYMLNIIIENNVEQVFFGKKKTIYPIT